jgi:hypothetical protein
MKSLLSSINTDFKFKPVHRMPLKPDPMSEYEIASFDTFLGKFEERTKIKSLSSSNNKILANRISYSTNDHTIVQFKRQVELTASKIYSVMTIYGNNELNITTIRNVLGLDNKLIEAALKML